MSTTETYATEGAIAIIAMNGRFPGAKNIDEFWQNLCNGVESISQFSDTELLAAGVDPEQIKNPYYVKARGVLEDIEQFDAPFFHFNPREAQIIDPQQRLFLECSWEALELSGYSTETYQGKIGVYTGISISTYLLRNLATNLELLESIGMHQVLLGNDKDFMAPLASYKLDLKGPGVTIQTGCSTSLVATHLACQALLNYQCDIALAGGSTIQLPQTAGYMYEAGGIASPDGHCRAFDANAQGTVGGNGVGIVVLKRLEDALTDRDQIYAVIKGSAINNDGNAKVGFTAPSIEGQSEVIAEAHAIADIDPASITYVETHGTGTMLGDPIELAALTRAFRLGTQEKQFCAIGSVKTNVGHLDSASGIVGLIKTALALKHKRIPASLNFEKPNPTIDFANSPFYVNTSLTEWKSGPTPRRAGVSSFGIGGTNAHMVLEEAPAPAPTSASRPWQLLTLSTQSQSSLNVATANLATYLKEPYAAPLADVAYTLHVGRKQFPHKRIAISQSTENVAQILETLEPQRVFSGFQETKHRSVIFMFPGAGAQYVNMGRELYQQEPLFRDVVDRCATLLQPKLQLDIRDVMYPAAEKEEEATQMMRKTATGMSALFTCEYALAQLWQAWGIRPQMMIGHSMGEYTAACLAGVFSLEDALSLVALRGQLFEQLPAGSMLSIPLSETDVLPFLGEELSLAAVNGPNLCVASGPVVAIQQLEQTLCAKGIDVRPIHIDAATHSSMLQPIIEPFTAFVRTCQLQKPTIPYISNVTGTWITEEEARDPVYWGNHLRQTVRFASGLQQLQQETDQVFLEVGPGKTLSSLAKQYMGPRNETPILSSVRHPYDTQPDQAFLLTTLGRLWLEGVSVDWDAFSARESRQRVALPTYPFERQAYWIQPHLKNPDFKALLGNATTQQAVKGFAPLWKQAYQPVVPTNEEASQGNWLVLYNDTTICTALVQYLRDKGLHVVAVKAGLEFSQQSQYDYTIAPAQSEQYEQLFSTLAAANINSDHILHLLTIMPADPTEPGANKIGQVSLFSLVQALGKFARADHIDLSVISNNIHSVIDTEEISPITAALLGICKVIPHEYPGISCRSIDIGNVVSGSMQEQRLPKQLMAELLNPASDLMVAYRGQQRWVQTFEPLPDLSTEQSLSLRDNGSYLLYGDVGISSLSLATMISSLNIRHLIWLGNQIMPPRQEWDQYLLQHLPQDPMYQCIQRMKALELQGLELHFMDSSSVDREMIARLEADYGQLRGVMYTAEITQDDVFQTIQETDPQQSWNLLQSKAQELAALEEAIHGKALDFCVISTALNPFLGQLGMVIDATLAAYLEAFIAQHNLSDENRWTYLNWTSWQGDAEQNALATTAPTHGRELRSNILQYLSFDMEHILISDQLPAYAVMLEQHKNAVQGLLPAAEQAATQVQAKRLSHYIAPTNQVEQQIVDIWQQLLGVETVSTHDNFFELGGHSLLGTQLVTRLRDTFHITLPLRTLFEQATVAELALIVIQQQAEHVESADIEELLAELENLSEQELQDMLSE